MSSKAAPKTVAPKADAAKGKKKLAGKKLVGKQWAQAHSHLFSNKGGNKKSMVIGKGVTPKMDMTHFVKWPLYVRIQRQRAVLKKRVRVPAAVNQFSKTITKDQAATLFQLLGKYRPETKQAKALRLKTVAAAQAKDAKVDATEKPLFIKYGLNHVTALVESKKAKLVVIAHDVDPIELVVWLPTLCRKMDVPFVIVKGKSRLGYLVHKKQASCLAITDVAKEDAAKLAQVADIAKLNFGTVERKSGGMKLSKRSIALVNAKKRASANTIKV